MIDSSLLPLNTEQRKLYNIVINQYSQEVSFDALLPCQLLLNVDSVARSRKTFALLKTCTLIQELVIKARKQNPLFQAALTGITAFNIVRKALYSLLQLPVKGKKSDFSFVTLQSL
jgi:hypothetical protein